MSVLVPRRVAAPYEKAVVGPGMAAQMTLTSLSSAMRSPQKMMQAAQALFHSDPWVRRAEETIDQVFATMAWHLEDENGDHIEDETAGAAGQALALMRKPQSALTDRQPMTRSQLTSLTCRHMGLCGSAFWLLDQMEGLGHTPLATLYINPARMTPAEDAQGNLTGWVVDYRGAAGTGVPLQLDEVLHFKLNEPDTGHFGIGIVESAMTKTALTRLSDSHAADVLASGGRLAGIVSAKVGGTIPDNIFQQLVRDFRTINEQPNAAKHVTVMQGPADFTAMAATPAELDLMKLMVQSRDDTLAMWGVPLSQIGGYSPAGLNSGDVRKYDYQALIQNAVHPRLIQFAEPLQFQLLDRYAKLGATVFLVVEEPTFTDDSPRYAMVQQSLNVAMTNDQRLSLVGFPPMPKEILGPSGLPLGDEVWMPGTLVCVSSPASAPIPAPDAGMTHEIEPDAAEAESDAATQAAGETSGKATLKGPAASMRQLRTNIEAHKTPQIRAAVAAFLATQKREIVALVQSKGAHLLAKPGDQSSWWNGKQWDQRLRAVLAGQMGGIAETVAGHVAQTFPSGKAIAAGDTTTPKVVKRVLDKGAARITAINETTRDEIAKIIAQGVVDGASAGGIGALIEQSTAFDQYRSEMIARTELTAAYNAAALGSYGEAGIEMVEAVDGDEDDLCAARDGQTYSIDDADAEEEHPNGTLDWLPVIE